MIRESDEGKSRIEVKNVVTLISNLELISMTLLQLPSTRYRDRRVGAIWWADSIMDEADWRDKFSNGDGTGTWRHPPMNRELTLDAGWEATKDIVVFVSNVHKIPIVPIFCNRVYIREI